MPSRACAAHSCGSGNGGHPARLENFTAACARASSACGVPLPRIRHSLACRLLLPHLRQSLTARPDTTRERGPRQSLLRNCAGFMRVRQMPPPRLPSPAGEGGRTIAASRLRESSVLAVVLPLPPQGRRVRLPSGRHGPQGRGAHFARTRKPCAITPLALRLPRRGPVPSPPTRLRLLRRRCVWPQPSRRAAHAPRRAFRRSVRRSPRADHPS